jgi:hypothetical protein
MFLFLQFIFHLFFHLIYFFIYLFIFVILWFGYFCCFADYARQLAEGQQSKLTIDIYEVK